MIMINEKNLQKDQGIGKRKLCLNCMGAGKFIISYQDIKKDIDMNQHECKFCKGTGRR